MTEKPLTDEELDAIERRGTPHHAGVRALTYSEWYPLLREVRRLRSELANARSVVSEDTAELRRLRGDEWLERAAGEIATVQVPLWLDARNHSLPQFLVRELRELGRQAMAILRKHREGA